MKDNRKLHRWELALLVGVAVAALVGSWLGGQQAALADQVIRLHVIAHSDSEADQALKLQVRDQVLAAARDLVPEGSSLQEARAVLEANLEQLAAAGVQAVEEAGRPYPVTASLNDQVWFPTKEYGDFALPAGNYTALRVVVGEGAGRNWWCVVFPPLCLGSVSEEGSAEELAEVFSPGQIGLVTGENEGYVVKFKAVELWEKLCRHLDRR